MLQVSKHKSRGLWNVSGSYRSSISGFLRCSRRLLGLDLAGDALPPALPGPDVQRQGAHHLPDALPHHPVCAPLPGPAQLPGGGDAHDEHDSGRSGSKAVRDLPQRPRHAGERRDTGFSTLRSFHMAVQRV